MAVSAWRIRPIQEGDAPSILLLARTLRQWFNEEGLAQIARDLGTHQGFVAVQRDRLLGFVTWNPIDAEVANLSWMGVAEDRHRSGIGSALLEALTLGLRTFGYRTLEVSTVADSVNYEPYANTRAFYRSMGFVDYHVDMGYFHDAGESYDRLLLRLALTPTASTPPRVEG